ncbi:DUF4240 domain-containing protein [Micromonospora sp. NBC_01699]|uniref:DUF4240 domain-containing protein n=1 Tax=Micromonospora sp. NBC_01699 TaxID=2975984 RepID=UPI002E29FCBB|nr:DUF4240 domain-containing protein [Micromonospora sp. NBC_01699]
MDIDGFWALIERSAVLADAPDDRLEWLTDRLAELPAAEITDFSVRLDELRRRADTHHLWGAAYRICGGLCSDDGFFYFQAWLVGLGREVFERVVRDPDELVEVPAVRRLAGRSSGDWDDDEWPDWEGLDYVADAAYERVTGGPDGLDAVLERDGHDLLLSPEPTDDDFDPRDRAQAVARYPRLAELFPLSPARL